MAKFLLFVVILAAVESHRIHPKFPTPDESPLIKKVACTNENERLRNEIIENARCGVPKEVFVYLKPPSKHEQVSPGAVWVKRCVGICDYEAPDCKCVGKTATMKPVPIRIYNAKTGRETCSTYYLEEHESCGCCPLSADDCGEPRVYNPRKCTCQCPNIEERRSCLQKRNQTLRWNRYKCTCEERKRRVQ